MHVSLVVALAVAHACLLILPAAAGLLISCDLPSLSCYGVSGRVHAGLLALQLALRLLCLHRRRAASMAFPGAFACSRVCNWSGLANKAEDVDHGKLLVAARSLEPLGTPMASIASPSPAPTSIWGSDSGGSATPELVSEPSDADEELEGWFLEQQPASQQKEPSPPAAQAAALACAVGEGGSSDKLGTLQSAAVAEIAAAGSWCDTVGHKLSACNKATAAATLASQQGHAGFCALCNDASCPSGAVVAARQAFGIDRHLPQAAGLGQVGLTATSRAPVYRSRLGGRLRTLHIKVHMLLAVRCMMVCNELCPCPCHSVTVCFLILAV
jgi:hypothetical protein